MSLHLKAWVVVNSDNKVIGRILQDPENDNYYFKLYRMDMGYETMFDGKDPLGIMRKIREKWVDVMFYQRDWSIED